jgi:carbon-monoxide dehydrogenase medium subunit
MTLVTPATIGEAIYHLATEDSRCIAGGQSLVAMMNAGLVSPATLVSLRSIDTLRHIEDRGPEGLRLGAMVPHVCVARHPPRSASAALLAETAGKIGYPAIRNRGTIGGSVCHADPAADYPTALTCAEASMIIVGPHGTRSVPADDFFEGFYETAVRPGELLIAIEIPAPPIGTLANYEKFAPIHGDFATLSVAAMIAVEDDICVFARLAVGACAPMPVRVPEAEHLLVGSRLGDEVVAAAGELLMAACDPIDDFRASASFRLKLLPRMVKRAIHAALAKNEAVHA